MSQFEPTNYRCTECGAEDRDKASYERSPDALICWNQHCRAGKKMPISDQVAAGYGMIPVQGESG